ncbi:hypothetical protein G7Y89_g5648 [Cudoniella acicularis]|uniref:Rhodopsin domain-containing protein n=1 Tax=Cudoniella acicularis TaxID=354080 RepID=A0A8H4RPD8_9HELO|nr:hypothetical protein G7Y89_g5648 [Cudoniella acicularis]
MLLDKQGLKLMGPKLIALDKMVYSSEIMVTAATTFARLSIPLFYAGIFITRSFRIAVYVMYAVIVGWGIAFTFTYTFQCNPSNPLWAQQQGKRVGCVDISVNFYYAVSTILIDVMVLALPWPMVWRLKMELKQKIAVLSIFMLGAIAESLRLVLENVTLSSQSASLSESATTIPIAKLRYSTGLSLNVASQLPALVSQLYCVELIAAS